jgi:hypothetical protein
MVGSSVNKKNKLIGGFKLIWIAYYNCHWSKIDQVKQTSKLFPL